LRGVAVPGDPTKCAASGGGGDGGGGGASGPQVNLREAIAR